jgi:hypothetical protein
MQLSPEIFDKHQSPATPLKRGRQVGSATPSKSLLKRSVRTSPRAVFKNSESGLELSPILPNQAQLEESAIIFASESLNGSDNAISHSDGSVSSDGEQEPIGSADCAGNFDKISSPKIDDQEFDSGTGGLVVDVAQDADATNGPKTPNVQVASSLLKSPKSLKTPNFYGLKQMMQTPVGRNGNEKVAVTPNMQGLSNLVKSPKAAKTPNFYGLKEMTKSPKGSHSPSLSGFQHMFKTSNSPKTPNFVGVKEVLKTPKQSRSPQMDDLAQIFTTPTKESVRITDQVTTEPVSFKRKRVRVKSGQKSPATPVQTTVTMPEVKESENPMKTPDHLPVSDCKSFEKKRIRVKSNDPTTPKTPVQIMPDLTVKSFANQAHVSEAQQDDDTGEVVVRRRSSIVSDNQNVAPVEELSVKENRTRSSKNKPIEPNPVVVESGPNLRKLRKKVSTEKVQEEEAASSSARQGDMNAMVPLQTGAHGNQELVLEEKRNRAKKVNKESGMSKITGKPPLPLANVEMPAPSSTDDQPEQLVNMGKVEAVATRRSRKTSGALENTAAANDRQEVQELVKEDKEEVVSSRKTRKASQPMPEVVDGKQKIKEQLTTRKSRKSSEPLAEVAASSNFDDQHEVKEQIATRKSRKPSEPLAEVVAPLNNFGKQQALDENYKLEPVKKASKSSAKKVLGEQNVEPADEDRPTKSQKKKTEEQPVRRSRRLLA